MSRRSALPPKVTDYHLPVEFLHVAQPWRVGKATFEPHGWLARHLDAMAEGGHPDRRREAMDALARFRADEVGGIKFATARVRARSAEEAIEVARDSIALARFYQRQVSGRASVDQQTFGLGLDVTVLVISHFTTDRFGASGMGFNRHGVLTEWTFTTDQITTIRADPTLRWLHTAFSKSSAKRTALEARAVTAIRFLNLATVMLRPAIRIVLVAAALEALLADGKSRDRAHRVAQRAAYLYCGTDRWGGREPNRHRWPERPACFYLAAADSQALNRERGRLKGKPGVEHTVCSWYRRVRQISDRRNAVLHDHRDNFEVRSAIDAETHADHVIRAAVDWAVESDASDLRQLDSEMRALLRRGVQQWHSAELSSYQDWVTKAGG